MKHMDLILLAAGVVVVLVLGFIGRRRHNRLNVNKCWSQWHDVQKYCANRKTWHQAIVEADKLLDDVLKRTHYKGKTTGERLVAAQHQLTDNETVWFGHKLRNRIVQENFLRPSKQDTLEALSGFRQALKDLGALVERGIGSERNEQGGATRRHA
jgi:hypothetical protein